MKDSLLNTIIVFTEEAKIANAPFITGANSQKIRHIARFLRNRAPVRFLLSCCVGKLDRPEVDIRKPYTEISRDDSYSGRTYDESYIQSIIDRYNLPCNSTTAFLTPVLRNINVVLTLDTVLVGNPKELYKVMLEVLNAVHLGELSVESLFKEMIHQLFIFKREEEDRIGQLIKNLEGGKDAQALSSEQIITLIQQHLASKNSSRLPVLVVAAAYQSVSNEIGESIMDLHAHNAADKQTGALGDIEVTLTNDENIVTSYEMKKSKRVTKSDIIGAVKKITAYDRKIDNYIFITTDAIEPDVFDYAKSLYDELGTEFAILDCIGFLRHFLHFFHRKRSDFLDNYQMLVLKEPNSSVGQVLKEAFLALRQAAEADR